MKSEYGANASEFGFTFGAFFGVQEVDCLTLLALDVCLLRIFRDIADLALSGANRVSVGAARRSYAHPSILNFLCGGSLSDN